MKQIKKEVKVNRDVSTKVGVNNVGKVDTEIFFHLYKVKNPKAA